MMTYYIQIHKLTDGYHIVCYYWASNIIQKQNKNILHLFYKLPRYMTSNSYIALNEVEKKRKKIICYHGNDSMVAFSKLKLFKIVHYI